MKVSLNGISHDFGGTLVLEGVTESVLPGDRIGIVGPNGSGKTTLVRILTGDLDPVSGNVVRESNTQIGFVPQHLEAEDSLTVGEFLLQHIFDRRERIRELEEEMAATDPGDETALARVITRYQHEREHYDLIEGDLAEERAVRLLGEMGLRPELDQQIRTLSGGERNVLSLTRALVDRPNLLVLDEPGNHLDFAGLNWLESYLTAFDGAVLIVSHNRYLLDKVCTGIWEIFGHRVHHYTGNYSDYRFNRLTQALSDQAVWSVQQRAISRLEALVRTFEQRARTTGDPAWGARLRARRSQLKKAKEIALDQPEVSERSIQVTFADGENKSDIAIHVADYSRSIGDLVLFERAELLVHVGERVGIVGPNGCGKTTFLRDLVDKGNWNNPGMRIGPSMRIAYCAQQRDRFRSGTSVHDAMISEGDHTRNEVFKVLSRLLFEWPDLERPVDSLSGGEWNRLQLGIAILNRANLLILDEPTNHLDIQSREAVEEALAEFSGTILAVSHDRYFLDASVSRIVEIADHRFNSVDGTFTEYWFRSGGNTPLKSASRERRGKQTRPQKQQSRDRPRTDENKKTEQSILELEEKQRALEGRMTAAFESGSHGDGRRIARELEKVRSRLEELYEKWGE